MAEIDWDKVLPLIKMNVKDLYLEMGAETQRKSDLERVKPLVAALQQILDYGTWDGIKAYAVLSDLGVLPACGGGGLDDA